MRKNINRGYQKLIVWQDAQQLYVQTCKLVQSFSFEMKRVASNQIASVDSVHRNIAEGYCRKSIREYLQFLNIANASLGESVSGMIAFRKADQISEEQFEQWDQLAYKLENGMIKLISSLEQKKRNNDWDDTLIVKESRVIYETE